VWQKGILFGFLSPALSLHFVGAFGPTSWFKWLGPTLFELIPQPGREKVGRKVSAAEESRRQHGTQRQSDSLFKNKQ